MLIADPPLPNPAMIGWARAQSGLPPARVAKRLGVKDSQVEDWESGRKHPTVRQIVKLAQLFERPVSLFFQSAPPREAPLAREYRRISGVIPGGESPELRKAIRHMLARRDIAAELLEELGYEVPEFSLTAHPSEPARVVGERIRAAVGISNERQAGWRDAWQAWREWRGAIEDLGVLVFMFPKVEMVEARGLSLLHGPLPVVAVNTREIAESRAYTALHELVHVMLANADEERDALSDTHTPNAFLELERFAEAVASYALIDEAALGQSVGRGPAEDDVRRLAQRFKVTQLALATRLRESGYWTWSRYQTWRSAWEAAATPRAPGGFATPISKTLGRGGRGFAQLVLEAFDSNRITTREAARYLDLRPDHFDNLRTRLSAGTAAEVPDE